MRIVVRGTNWIGDAVMTTPAMRQLRKLFPQAHIALHTRPWAAGIFSDSGLFDDIISIAGGKGKLASTIGQAAALRAQDFDMAILMPNSFATAFTVRLADIPKRVGYASDGRGFLLTNAIKVPAWKGEKHEVFYYLNLIGQIEAELLGTAETQFAAAEPLLEVSAERRAKAVRLLAASNVDTSKKTIVLTPGSTNSLAKRWGAERYARLNDLLQSELDVNVILMGSPDEADVSNAVTSLSVKKPIDLTGKTELAEAAAVLAESDLLISNDMGLAHLAPAVGTDTIVIFGPTNHVTTRPLSGKAEIIRSDVECSPCMLRECPIDHRCMTQITPEQVLRQATLKLDF